MGVGGTASAVCEAEVAEDEPVVVVPGEARVVEEQGGEVEAELEGAAEGQASGGAEEPPVAEDGDGVGVDGVESAGEARESGA